MKSTSEHRERDDQVRALLLGLTEGLPDRQDLVAWERWADTCRQTGFAGLALRALERSNVRAPAEARDSLRAAAEQIGAGNARVLRRLAELLVNFRRAGVDVMVLKGAALIWVLYGDPSLRPMCDVDLLVRERDLVEVDAVLTAAGFRRPRAMLRDDFFPRYYYEVAYVSDGPLPMHLDVHVRPWRPLRWARAVSEDAWWACRRRVTVGETPVDLPDHEAMLLHLTGHAGFHGATRLLWLFDIHEYLHRFGSEIDWSVVLKRACAWRLTPVMWWVLDQVERRLGPCVPQAAREGWSRRAPWRDRLALWQAPRDRRAPWMRTLVDLVCTDGWRYRWEYLAAVAWPNDAHLSERYPRGRPAWRWRARFARALRPSRRALRPSASDTRA